MSENNLKLAHNTQKNTTGNDKQEKHLMKNNQLLDEHTITSQPLTKPPGHVSY